jgi:hypothetical protein
MELVRVVEAVVRVVASEWIRAVADQALEAAEVGEASGSESGMNETGAAEHVHVVVVVVFVVERSLLLSVEIDF